MLIYDIFTPNTPPDIENSIINIPLRSKFNVILLLFVIIPNKKIIEKIIIPQINPYIIHLFSEICPDTYPERNVDKEIIIKLKGPSTKLGNPPL